MNEIEFTIGRTTIMGMHDVAYVMPDEDPLATLVMSAVSTISTEIEITCGGVTMHLAAWQDPEHWEEDWREKGFTPEEVHDLVAIQAK